MIKKKAAAISAVMSYIQEEEEIAAMQSLSAPSGQTGQKQGPIKLWSINGRQAQMQMRNLMQMKAFHGGKF